MTEEINTPNDPIDTHTQEASRRLVDGPHTLKTDASDLLRFLRQDETLTGPQIARAKKIGFRGLVAVGVIAAVTVVGGQIAQRQSNTNVETSVTNSEQATPSPQVLKEIKEATNTYSSNEKLVGTFTIDAKNTSPTVGIENVLAEHPEVKIDPSNLDFSAFTAQQSGKDVEVDNSVLPGEKFQVVEEDVNHDGKDEIIVEPYLPPPLTLDQGDGLANTDSYDPDSYNPATVPKNTSELAQQNAANKKAYDDAIATHNGSEPLPSPIVQPGN